jgi:DNA-binding MarR family transcriptional regulator
MFVATPWAKGVQMEATGLRSYLGYLLSEAERAVNRGLAGVLTAEGVSVEQWRILRALSDGRGHSMGDLAEAALMPHPTLTKAVDRLVDDALVYRRQDPADRRRVAVYLSDRGEALVDRLDACVATHHDTVESAYGRERTERLMRELSSLVARLAE